MNEIKLTKKNIKTYLIQWEFDGLIKQFDDTYLSVGLYTHISRTDENHIRKCHNIIGHLLTIIFNIDCNNIDYTVAYYDYDTKKYIIKPLNEVTATLFKGLRIT